MSHTASLAFSRFSSSLFFSTISFSLLSFSLSLTALSYFFVSSFLGTLTPNAPAIILFAVDVVFSGRFSEAGTDVGRDDGGEERLPSHVGCFTPCGVDQIRLGELGVGGGASVPLGALEWLGVNGPAAGFLRRAVGMSSSSAFTSDSEETSSSQDSAGARFEAFDLMESFDIDETTSEGAGLEAHRLGERETDDGTFRFRGHLERAAELGWCLKLLA